MVKRIDSKRPAKPYPEFPLYAASNGCWAKTVNGKRHYFGAWDNPQAGYQKYKREIDALQHGIVPTPDTDDLRLAQLVKSFLVFKRDKQVPKITAGTLQDYKDNCKAVLAMFGRTRKVSNIGPLDFQKLHAESAKTHNTITLKRDVACTRALFHYCDDTFNIRVRHGKYFRKPSRAEIRRNTKERESRMYEPAELQGIIKAADPQLRAMILLGLNCGFGNRDCTYLTPDVIDFEGGWISYERNKTGKDRRSPLWAETLRAIKAAQNTRPTPKVECDNIFIELFHPQ